MSKTFACRVADALARAESEGFEPTYVAVAPTDWPPNYPVINLKSDPKAAGSVLWAFDKHGTRLKPFPLGGEA